LAGGGKPGEQQAEPTEADDKRPGIPSGPHEKHDPAPELLH
jgi:hypothetical protein